VKSDLFIALKGHKAFFLNNHPHTKVVRFNSYAPGPGATFFYSLFLYDFPIVAEGEVLIFDVRFHCIYSLLIMRPTLTKSTFVDFPSERKRLHGVIIT